MHDMPVDDANAAAALHMRKSACLSWSFEADVHPWSAHVYNDELQGATSLPAATALLCTVEIETKLKSPADTVFAILQCELHNEGRCDVRNGEGSTFGQGNVALPKWLEPFGRCIVLVQLIDRDSVGFPSRQNAAKQVDCVKETRSLHARIVYTKTCCGGQMAAGFSSHLLRAILQHTTDTPMGLGFTDRLAEFAKSIGTDTLPYPLLAPLGPFGVDPTGISPSHQRRDTFLPTFLLTPLMVNSNCRVPAGNPIYISTQDVTIAFLTPRYSPLCLPSAASANYQDQHPATKTVLAGNNVLPLLIEITREELPNLLQSIEDNEGATAAVVPLRHATGTGQQKYFNQVCGWVERLLPKLALSFAVGRAVADSSSGSKTASTVVVILHGAEQSSIPLKKWTSIVSTLTEKILRWPLSAAASSALVSLRISIVFTWDTSVGPVIPSRLSEYFQIWPETKEETQLLASFRTSRWERGAAVRVLPLMRQRVLLPEKFADPTSVLHEYSRQKFILNTHLVQECLEAVATDSGAPESPSTTWKTQNVSLAEFQLLKRLTVNCQRERSHADHNNAPTNKAEEVSSASRARCLDFIKTNVLDELHYSAALTKHFGLKGAPRILITGIQDPTTVSDAVRSLLQQLSPAVRYVLFEQNLRLLLSPWMGECEENLRSFFSTARGDAPSIIVLSGLEMLPKRTHDNSRAERHQLRLLTTLLLCLDSVNEGNDSDMGVIGVSLQSPQELDEALVRANRFDRWIRF